MSLKSSPVNVRTSAVLLGGGAYDAAAVVVDTKAYAQLELRISYTQGAASGSARFKMLVASDSAGPWYERTIDDGTVNVIAGTGESYSNLYTSVKQLPVSVGASAELRTYIIDVSTARYVKFLFAEVGNKGSPGTVAADCILGADE